MLRHIPQAYNFPPLLPQPQLPPTAMTWADDKFKPTKKAYLLRTQEEKWWDKEKIFLECIAKKGSNNLVGLLEPFWIDVKGKMSCV